MEEYCRIEDQQHEKRKKNKFTELEKTIVENKVELTEIMNDYMNQINNTNLLTKNLEENVKNNVIKIDLNVSYI